MAVPINNAIIDAPSISPGMRLSTRIDSAATAKQMTKPNINNPLSFNFVFMMCLDSEFYFCQAILYHGVDENATSYLNFFNLYGRKKFFTSKHF